MGEPAWFIRLAGLRDSFWLQAMQSGFIGVMECIKAFSETDFTADLKNLTYQRLFFTAMTTRLCRLQTLLCCQPNLSKVPR